MFTLTLKPRIHPRRAATRTWYTCAPCTRYTRYGFTCSRNAAPDPRGAQHFLPRPTDAHDTTDSTRTSDPPSQTHRTATCERRLCLVLDAVARCSRSMRMCMRMHRTRPYAPPCHYQMYLAMAAIIYGHMFAVYARRRGTPSPLLLLLILWRRPLLLPGP